MSSSKSILCSPISHASHVTLPQISHPTPHTASIENLISFLHKFFGGENLNLKDFNLSTQELIILIELLRRKYRLEIDWE